MGAVRVRVPVTLTVRVRVWAPRLFAQLFKQPCAVLVRGRDSVRARERVRGRGGVRLG